MNTLNTLLLTSMVTMTLLMIAGIVLMTGIVLTKRQNKIAGPIFVIIFWLAVLTGSGFIVKILSN